MRCGYATVQRKTNGVSYIIQKGGAVVFTEEGQRQIRERIQVYKNNAKVLMDALDQLGIWYCGGKNAPYIWMKCPNGMGSWEFFDYLLHEIRGCGNTGRRVWSLWRRLFPVFNFWLTGRYKRSGRKACKAAFKMRKEVQEMFDAGKVTKDCIDWIRDFFEQNGQDCNAVVGISGGKDSSVVAALCVEALGKERVIGVLMPCGEQGDIDMAYRLVQHLGIRYFIVNIKDLLMQLQKYRDLRIP